MTLRKIVLLICLILLVPAIQGQDPKWGLIANPGFEEGAIKSTVFFTGNWRNGIQFYDFNPSVNTGLFTVYPADAQHLGWSESAANREFALNWMTEAGINLINMSYWGLPGTDNWAWWAPMQCSTASHDELFTTALEKNILIAPFIESYAATDNFDGFSFADDFPGTAENPAPRLVAQIEDLVDRYLLNPDNTEWPSKWARIYDREGNERYLISIIHVASNKAGITHQEFAGGFDAVANQVFTDTEVRIGFALDILPPDSYAPGIYKATPSQTGSYLSQQSSILAIQCFIPEIWQGESNEDLLIEWKAEFAADWIDTGIPWIHDISSGYDAHIVFPTSPVYGNNEHWRHLQDSLLEEINATAFAFNAWNGFTEGMAGMPTAEYGSACYNWICGLLDGNCWYDPGSIEPDLATAPVIYPNPTRKMVYIENKTVVDSPCRVVIYNLSGKLVFSEERIRRTNRNTIYLDTSHLKPGAYLLHLNYQDQKTMNSLLLIY